MVGIFQGLFVLAAVIALGWAALKCSDLIAEAFGVSIPRQLRTLVKLDVSVIAAIFILVLAVMTLSAALLGTECEPGSDPMSCAPNN